MYSSCQIENQNKLCQKTFSVRGSGIGKLRSHEINKLSSIWVERREGKSLFSKDENNKINLKASKYIFTVVKEIQKAEIIQKQFSVSGSGKPEKSNLCLVKIKTIK